MSREYAVSVWRSVRTTFLLFVILVPAILVFNIAGTEGAGARLRELAPSAAGMVIFAGALAEIGRRLINHFAGEPVCHWWSTQ